MRPDPVAISFVVAPVGRGDLPARIRLSWLAAEATPRIGDTWRLQARLRRPRGYSNPGGFDYEGWLFRQEIGATGYVIAGPESYQVRGERMPSLSRLRRAVVERIERALPSDDARAVLLAIGVGARHEIRREQWDLYARTGTSHLMAISGLHIGLAATTVFLATWSMLGLVVAPAQYHGLGGARRSAGCVAYAALSGFAVPARRASIMASCAGSMVLLRRRVSPGVLISAPCLLIFLATPIAILSPGFKLSFAAVAILLFVARRYYRPFPGLACPMPTGPFTGYGKFFSFNWLCWLACFL